MYLTTVSSAVIIYILIENELSKRKIHKRQEAKQNELKRSQRSNGTLVSAKEGDITMTSR